MSIILQILERARGKTVGAKTGMQFQTATTEIPFNTNYEWDNGVGLFNFDAQGAGTPELSGNMENLSHLLNDNPELTESPFTITPEVQPYIAGIADARGISVAQAEQDYLRMLALMEQQGLEFGTARGYGSESQLRFGFVVGEALELDPAFASLMSPDGGFTGPGSISADIDGDGLFEEVASGFTGVSNEALAFHAPTHDAFGFLDKNFEGTEPGYCYVPDAGDCHFGEDSSLKPLNGQVSGINYWDETIDHGPLDAASNAGNEILEEVTEGFAETGAEISEARTEVSEELEEAGGEILREAYEGDYIGTASEFIEGGGEVLWETGEGVFETGREGVETGLEVTREATEGVVDFTNEIIDEAKGDGVPFIPGI